MRELACRGDASLTDRTTHSLAAILMPPLACFGLGVWSMHAAPLLLFTAIVFVFHDGPGLALMRRVHTSLLLGTGLAWALLPHSIFAFARHGLGPSPTGMQGCQVMALAGFPIQQVGGHGGGGWRFMSHTATDHFVHAANGLILAAVVWFVLAVVPLRRLALVHGIAWLLFLPACVYGFAGMAPWWD